MTDPRTDRDAENTSANQPSEPVRYPEHHLLAVIDTPEQVRAVLDGLTDADFSSSEVTVACGRAAAEALGASTGRTGLSRLAVRIAERSGIANDEMRMKDRYEQALRDGRFVLSVPASGDERKATAAQILRNGGGHFIHYLGSFTIEKMHD